MPTQDQPPVVAGPSADELSGRPSCPQQSDIMAEVRDANNQLHHTLEPRSPGVDIPGKNVHDDPSSPARDTPTPVSVSVEDALNGEVDNRNIANGLHSPEPLSQGTSLAQWSRNNYDLLVDPFPTTRFRPNTSSSFLKPGIKLSGLQTSDKAKYDVVVEVQHMDMENSFMCGYLNIRGLTDEHPSLTTYFEGEMVGTKYSFRTEHADWGANEKTDLHHWANFPAFRPIAKDAKRSNYHIKNWQQKEHIFMRWKEYFLVPDHKIRDLTNASFDGFYYICFNQITGAVQGTYYHHRSDKNQQLNLKPTEELGFDYGFEFR